MSKRDKDRISLLGEAIKSMREEQNLSQEKLALMSGTGQSYLSRVETGKLAAGIDKIIRIADALGTDVKSLIDF